MTPELVTEIAALVAERDRNRARNREIAKRLRALRMALRRAPNTESEFDWPYEPPEDAEYERPEDDPDWVSVAAGDPAPVPTHPFGPGY